MKRSLGLVAAFAVALVLAGCSDKPAATPEEKTAWANDFCGAMLEFKNNIPVVPTEKPPTAAEQKAAAEKLLSDYEQYLEVGIGGLAKLPPAPYAVGDEARNKTISVFQPILDSVKNARTKLAGVSSLDDPQAKAEVQQALIDFQEKANLINNPLEGLQGTEELEAAGQNAPNCQKLATAE